MAISNSRQTRGVGQGGETGQLYDLGSDHIVLDPRPNKPPFDKPIGLVHSVYHVFIVNHLSSFLLMPPLRSLSPLDAPLYCDDRVPPLEGTGV